MTTIEQTYVDALLADATYVKGWIDGASATGLTTSLSPRMTPVLAKFIGDNFEVVAHKETDENFESGFDATVWRGRAGTAYDGKVYVSMRGTECLGNVSLMPS